MPEPIPAEIAAEAPDAPHPALLDRRGRVRPVLTYPDPMLRRICTPVGQLDWTSLSQLAADLLATMYAAGGRGLAAPQIGEPYRIFVMDHGWKNGSPLPRIVLDPEVIPMGSDTEAMEEGCLSIPDRPVTVRRPVMISLRAFDLMGDLVTQPLTGIEARIVQHEADHLDGRLILDFLDAPDTPANG